MRLLILTQKVDIEDSVLGFFHRWIEEFAKCCEKLTVICLQKGEYNLPQNVRVLSLGKERNQSKIKYLWNFYKYIFKYKNNYDGVFVHMNKEYVLLGGFWWKLWNKKMALWYTHKAVSWQLKLAEKLVDKIFTASKESFRLPSRKVEVVGHGIPVEQFAVKKFEPPPISVGGISFLMVGRITPSKDLEIAIKAVAELRQKKDLPLFSLDIVGDAITEGDIEYESMLKELDNRINAKVSFQSSMIYQEMDRLYQSHHLMIHASRTGSIDKVVLEALASGRLVISSSEAFADLAKEGLIHTFPAGDYKALANKIEEIYQSGALERIPDQKAIDYVRKNHNLDNLIKKIASFYVT